VPRAGRRASLPRSTNTHSRAKSSDVRRVPRSSCPARAPSPGQFLQYPAEKRATRCPPWSRLRPPSRRSQPRRAVAKPPPIPSPQDSSHPRASLPAAHRIAPLPQALVRDRSYKKPGSVPPRSPRRNACHFVDHCVDSVPVISIDPQVRARRSEKREEANVAAQVGSQLQKASESTEADDLVLAWIESIHANNRLLSFVAALSSLPARPRGQPLARSRDRWRLHRLFHRGRIGARGKGAHPNESSIPRCDGSVLVIDLRTEQFFAATEESSRVPFGLHSHHVGTKKALENRVAPALRDQFEHRKTGKGNVREVQARHIRKNLPKQRGQ